MKDLRCHTVHLFFKVLDSDMFGGDGTIGYVNSNAGECWPVPNEESEKRHIEKMRKIFADQMEVPVDKVIQISRDEYRGNTEEEDDDYGDEDEDDYGDEDDE